MERYVIQLTTLVNDMHPINRYFERFGKDGNTPIVGPYPKLYETKQAAKNTMGFIREWAKTEYPDLIIDTVQLPNAIKQNWRFNKKDLEEARKMANKLGYRKIQSKPQLERLAMRKKAFGSWYFVLSINEFSADLQLENKNRWRIRTIELQEDNIGQSHLIEAEDEMLAWAITNNV